jgi:hypothetical protein
MIVHCGLSSGVGTTITTRDCGGRCGHIRRDYSISIPAHFVSTPCLVFRLQILLPVTVKPLPKKRMSTSALSRYHDEMEDPDLRKYSRRISLRAPPLPNLVNIPRHGIRFPPI